MLLTVVIFHSIAVEPLLDQDMLRDYICHVHKMVHPKMSDLVVHTLVCLCLELCCGSTGNTCTISATSQKVESLLWLSKVLACS